MINFALRYRPILESLRQQPPESVLEVGSGPEGLALFWRGRVVGVDLGFKRRPLHQAIAASVLALPWADKSWPMVVSCDTLEHIPPADRRRAVREIARVAGERIWLAFPSGPAAETCYRQLAQRLGPELPKWLTDHLTYGLPDAAQVNAWLQAEGWATQLTWYEAAGAHQRLMVWESRRWVQPFTFGLMRLFGPYLAPHWPTSQAEPPLRALITAV